MRHAIGQHVMDVVLWVMFAVIVQAIRPVSSLHVSNAVMWVIFAVIVPRNLDGTKEK